MGIMTARNYRDIIGGAAVTLAGSFTIVHAMTTLNIGTVSQMGPGMFPVALGAILVGLGFTILIPAFVGGGGEMPRVNFRSLAMVGASMVAFALIARPLGLVPAIFALTFIAGRADGKMSLAGTVLLAAGLSLVVTLIFRVGLGLRLPIFNWPW